MDDGTYTLNRSKKGKAPQRYYRFSTQSFALEDQALLVEGSRDNFDIDATIQKQGSQYLLYIR